MNVDYSDLDTKNETYLPDIHTHISPMPCYRLLAIVLARLALYIRNSIFIYLIESSNAPANQP